MLPKPINPQTLLGIKQDSSAYETAKATIDAHNQLIQSLGAGPALSGAHFSTSTGISIQVGSISGTLKRGKFTVIISAQVTANPTINIGFPSGLFEGQPFAQVIRNGGNGLNAFSYTESATGIIVKITGTPNSGESYGFQFAVRD